MGQSARVQYEQPNEEESSPSAEAQADDEKRKAVTLRLRRIKQPDGKTTFVPEE
jgi:hypothetical protein